MFLKKLFFGCSFFLMVANSNAFAQSHSATDGSEFKNAYLNLNGNNNENQENKQTENSYQSDIETIESSDKKGFSFVIYSRDNSTGFCWVNAQSDNAYKLNVMVPHLNFTSSSFPDPNCVYFYAAKKNKGV